MFIPSVGSFLVVSLPGETMRAKVDRVVNRNTVLVTLGQPMAKSHAYRLGEVVACRRTPAREFGNETWDVIEVPRVPPAIPPDEPKRKGKN
jgi:hypothetical protein